MGITLGYDTTNPGGSLYVCEVRIEGRERRKKEREGREREKGERERREREREEGERGSVREREKGEIEKTIADWV